MQILVIPIWLITIGLALYALVDLYRNPDWLSEKPSPTGYFLFIVYLIVLATFFKGGLEQILFFIPQKWGVKDELGEFNSVKLTISWGIGTWMSLWIGCVIIPKFFKRSDLIRKIEEGSKGLTDLEKSDKTKVLGEYGESEFVIRQLDKSRSLHANIKNYVDTRKAEIEATVTKPLQSPSTNSIHPLTALIEKIQQAPAKVVEWYSVEDGSPLECKICGWNGTLKDCPSEIYSELADYSCPKCEKMLLVRKFPLASEEFARILRDRDTNIGDDA